MKVILSIREKPKDGTRKEFVRGSVGTVQRKIINLIDKNPWGQYDFLVSDDGSKSIKTTDELAGEVINIVDDKYIAEFTEDSDGNTMILVSDSNTNEGALPQQRTIDQLKKLRKKTRGTDIGDKISDMTKQGANINHIRNPIDTGVESIQNFWKNSKYFQPGWNLKHLEPYKEYPIPTSIGKKKKKKK